MIEILVRISALTVVSILGLGLLWSIWRTRQVQQQMSSSYGGTDSDGVWTFGQIVAVTLFAPVLVEAIRSRKDKKATLASKDGSIELFRKSNMPHPIHANAT